MIERRAFPVEFRVKRDDDNAKIVGHAAVFNSLSVELFGFREEVSPGAFTQTIQQDDVRALFNHDPNFVLGRNVAKTLRLSEDEKGLMYEIDPPDTQFARDLMVSIERGDITQNSFSFSVLPDGQEWREDSAGTLIRTLTHVKLYDISPVTFPAYPSTDVSLRSAEAEALAAEGRRILEAHRPGFTWQVENDLRRRKVDLIEKY